MRNFLIISVLGFALNLHAEGIPTGLAELRRLSKLPTVNLSLGLGLNYDGFVLQGDRADPEVEIAALKKSMDGSLEDAERYLRLGVLQSKEQGAESLNKAIDLFRQRVEAKPHDGSTMSGLAKALSAAGKPVEAEKYFRESTKASPEDWQCWAELGNFLSSRARDIAFGNENGNGSRIDSGQAMPTNRVKPGPDQLNQAHSLLAEALAADDKAVAAAKNEPGPYLARATIIIATNLFQQLSNPVTDESHSQTAIFASSWSSALEDLKQAANLDPKNYQAIGMVIFGELAKVMPYLKDHASNEAILNKLSDSSQRTVKDAMNKLQFLTHDSDPKICAGALMVFGMTQIMVLGDVSGAEGSYRRAVALDPSRNEAWKMLMLMLVRSEKFPDLEQVCEEHLKVAATTENYFMLAKAEAKLGKLDKAEAQLRAALKLSPKDFNANAGLAALLLKKLDDESFAQAASHLQQAKLALDVMPPKEATDDQKVVLTFNLGIAYALEGRTNDARKAFKMILDHDPKDEDAKAAIAALGN